MAFLVALVAVSKARMTDHTRLGGLAGDERHNAYLCSSPCVALNPLLLSVKEQAMLLGGTPVGCETVLE